MMPKVATSSGRAFATIPALCFRPIITIMVVDFEDDRGLLRHGVDIVREEGS